MAEKEGVDWFVPFARELVPRGCVPPVFVELPVGKAGVENQRKVWVLEETAYRESSAKPLQMHSAGQVRFIGSLRWSGNTPKMR